MPYLPTPLQARQDDDSQLPTPAVEPLEGTIIGLILSMVAIATLTSFLTQRTLAIKNWRKLPFLVWLVLAIFIDSWIFVFLTAILKNGIGLNSSFGLCSSAIILCLACYLTTKMLYLFLVEKAFVVRNGHKSRMKSKLYLFNSFGMLSLYAVVAVLNFTHRITRLDGGVCVIGMQKLAMVPLITFDLAVNVYLTSLFLIPLLSLYSFKNKVRNQSSERLRKVAFRTFIGAVCTTISSVVNLSVLMALDGEPGWVCLMCCNADILFSAIVLQWITSSDNAATGNTTTSMTVNKRSHHTTTNNINNNDDDKEEGFWPSSPSPRTQISGSSQENQINMKTFEVKVTTKDKRESTSSEPDPFSTKYGRDERPKEGRKSQDSKGSTAKIIS